MKKLFIGMIVVLALVVAPTNAHAITIAELQALIVQLTAQLNLLLAQQNPIQPVEIINPTATSTGLVSFVEKPTLKLVYDSNRNESKLEGSATVRVDVGSEDILIGSLELAIMDAKGSSFSTKSHTRSILGISGATQTFSDVYANTWLVKAGTSAIFKLTTTENPQMLFAGSYITTLYPVSIIVKDTAGNLGKKDLAYSNTKSIPVTIIGEKSPYISSSSFSGENVVISGYRFIKGDRVYVNNVYKGKLQDFGYLGNNLTNGTFPISWLAPTPTGKGGCPLYGNIQVENVKYEKSNYFGVSKECGITTPSVQVVANQLTKASLDLSYDSSKNEVALNGNQQFSVMAGSDDVYVYSAGITINRISGEYVTPKSGWVPNGVKYGLGVLSNTVQKNFIDSYGNNQTGWLVKAGEKASFVSKIYMNPQLMYSGVYNAEINNVSFYSNGNYGSVVWKGDSMPSNGVKIIGEKTVPSIAYPSSPTVLYPNGGETLTLDKNTFLITFRPLYGKVNSVELIGSDGSVYNLGSFTGEATDKQAVNIDTVYMNKLGVKSGSYKVRVCLNLSDRYDSLCDTSDSYFTIATAPVVAPPTLPPPLFVGISSPNTSDSLTVGQNYRIKWNNSSGVDKVTIGYSFGEGSLNWFANNSANNIPNTGYYDWDVNIGNTTNTRVRLCIIAYQTGVNSVSSCTGYFTVNPAVAIYPPTRETSPTRTIYPTGATTTIMFPTVSATTSSTISPRPSSTVSPRPRVIMPAPVSATTTVSRNDKINSIAAALEAIKEILKGM